MRPAAAGVELGNQLQQAGLGGVDVGGELGDALAEGFVGELRGGLSCALRIRSDYTVIIISLVRRH